MASKPLIKCVQLILLILSDEGEVLRPNCSMNTHEYSNIISVLASEFFSKEQLKIK